MSKKSYAKLNVTLIQNLEKKIEELKRTEAFSKNILSAIPIGLDIVDEHGTIQFLNKVFLKAFGKQAIGKKCWEIYKDNKKQCKNCPLKKSITIGKAKTLEVSGVAGGRTFLITHTGIRLPDGSKAEMEEKLRRQKENMKNKSGLEKWKQKKKN